MNTQTKGDLSELRYAARLKELGHTVLFPFTENEYYDLVADNGVEMIRIQVKSSIREGDRIHFYCHNEDTYTADQIDGIGVYNGDFDECWFVPFEDLNDYHMTLSKEDGAKHPADEYSLRDL